MVSGHRLQLTVTPAASAPSKSIGLSLEALWPFSSLAVKVLHGIIFQYKAVSCTWVTLLSSIATSTHCLSLVQLLHQHLLLHLAL